jgi:phospholipid/cholesterol/gamma-HCH transport system permease protein
VGRAAFAWVGETGRATNFLLQAVRHLPMVATRLRMLGEQLFFIGNRSLLVVSLTASFTGLVLALQGYNALVRFGAEQMVGALVSLSLCRELGPVLAALMVTARAGSAMAATLGNMRVTEQIDALRTMAIDPIDYLIVPRMVAALVTVPLLTALFNVIGLIAAQSFSSSVLGLEGSRFMTSASDATEWSDVSAGLWKSLAFALIMVWISTYRGFNARGGAKGVGQATTRAVVETSVLILALDYMLTAFLF